MLKYDLEVVTTLKSQLLGAMSLLRELKSKEMKTLEDDPHLLSSAKYKIQFSFIPCLLLEKVL